MLILGRMIIAAEKACTLSFGLTSFYVLSNRFRINGYDVFSLFHMVFMHIRAQEIGKTIEESRHLPKCAFKDGFKIFAVKQ
jgi:hypothetical protein